MDNPGPYRSVLWAHLEEIRSWRALGDTWKEIASKLFRIHNIKVSTQGVHLFFKRSDKVREPIGMKINKQKPDSVLQRIINKPGQQ